MQNLRKIKTVQNILCVSLIVSGSLSLFFSVISFLQSSFTFLIPVFFDSFYLTEQYIQIVHVFRNMSFFLAKWISPIDTVCYILSMILLIILSYWGSEPQKRRVAIFFILILVMLGISYFYTFDFIFDYLTSKFSVPYPFLWIDMGIRLALFIPMYIFAVLAWKGFRDSIIIKYSSEPLELQKPIKRILLSWHISLVGYCLSLGFGLIGMQIVDFLSTLVGPIGYVVLEILIWITLAIIYFLPLLSSVFSFIGYLQFGIKFRKTASIMSSEPLLDGLPQNGFCGKCGGAVEPNMDFCPNCGNNLRFQ